jgi:hypothetical protein
MKLLSLLLGLLFWSLPLFAQKAKPHREAPHAAVLANLQKGDPFRSNSETYRVLPEVYATRQTASQSPQVKPMQTPSSTASSELLEQRGPFQIRRYTSAPSSSLRATPQSSSAFSVTSGYPVVLNTRTQRLGILMGTLLVRLNEATQVETLAQQHGLTLEHHFPHLRAAVLRFSAKQNPVTVLQELRADPGVRSANLEVLERLKVPR